MELRLDGRVVLPESFIMPHTARRTEPRRAAAVSLSLERIRLFISGTEHVAYSKKNDTAATRRGSVPCDFALGLLRRGQD